MRVAFIVHFAVIALVSGCAFEGTVVEKRFRPFPFYDSVGIDGIYKFRLRDRSGQMREQLVAPDVFANYEIGDYFSDLRPLTSNNPKDFKSIARTSIDTDPTQYRPTQATFAGQRKSRHAAGIAKTRHPSRHATRIATVHHRARHPSKTARTRQQKKHSTKTVRLQRSRHLHTQA